MGKQGKGAVSHNSLLTAGGLYLQKHTSSYSEFSNSKCFLMFYKAQNLKKYPSIMQWYKATAQVSSVLFFKSV